MKDNNKFYIDIQINHLALQSLSVNGIPSELLTLEVHKQLGSPIDEETGPQCSNDDDELQEAHLDRLPIPQQEHLEDDVIHVTINDEDPIDWPTISGQPINEF